MLAQFDHLALFCFYLNSPHLFIDTKGFHVAFNKFNRLLVIMLTGTIIERDTACLMAHHHDRHV